MVKRALALALSLCCGLAASPAWALFEIRAGLGGSSVNPETFNADKSTSDAKTTSLTMVLLDSSVNVSILSVGVRGQFQTSGERTNLPTSGTSYKYSLNHMSFSPLARLRLRQDDFYGGIVGTVAASRFSYYQYKSSSDSNTHTLILEPDGPSWTAAAEGGMMFDKTHIMVGGELGYQSLKFKQADLTGVTSTNGALDLSGPYILIIAGLFF